MIKKIKPIIYSLIIVLAINILLFGLVTVREYSYDKNLPNHSSVFSFFEDNKNISTCYLNEAGDVNADDSNKIDDLLKQTVFSKTSPLESYYKLFFLSRTSFLLLGKTYIQPEKAAITSEQLFKYTIFVEDNCTYVIYKKNNSNDFAVYKNTDKLLAEELLDYKAEGPYNVCLPDWKNDLLQLNSSGKCIVLSWFVELSVVYFCLYKLEKNLENKMKNDKGKFTKPLKK